GLVPVQAHHGRVVLEVFVAGFQYEWGHVLHEFPGVQTPGRREFGGQVDAGRVAVDHSVGDQEDTVAGVELEVVNGVAAVGEHAEGGIRGPGDLLDGGGAHQVEREMAGVDGAQHPGGQLDVEQ